MKKTLRLVLFNTSASEARNRTMAKLQSREELKPKRWSDDHNGLEQSRCLCVLLKTFRGPAIEERIPAILQRKVCL